MSLNFNPRPLAGATYFDEDEIRKVLISIHAPLRGRHNRSGFISRHH